MPAAFSIAIETNGTLAVPEDIDWVCVSPKAGQPNSCRQWGDELKARLSAGRASTRRNTAADLEFEHRFLQPMDGPARAINTEAAIAYCKANPPWRLSVQTHKILGIP